MTGPHATLAAIARSALARHNDPERAVAAVLDAAADRPDLHAALMGDAARRAAQELVRRIAAPDDDAPAHPDLQLARLFRTPLMRRHHDAAVRRVTAAAAALAAADRPADARFWAGQLDARCAAAEAQTLRTLAARLLHDGDAGRPLHDQIALDAALASLSSRLGRDPDALRAELSPPAAEAAA